VATEEGLERKYRLEPGPAVLSKFERQGSDYVAALHDVARLGTIRDRALVRSLGGLQRHYRTAIGHMFAAVDSHTPHKVLDIDVHQVDPLFTVIEVRVDRAAAAHRIIGLRHTTALSQEASAIKLATPIAFLVGMALLAFFASLLAKQGRRHAVREAEVLVLAKAALEDSLTGLSNRRKLAEDLEQALARASASAPLALMVFDLDGFKDYNDAFGHPAGDALLARLARRLRTAAGAAGEAYRLGGDEFCLLAPAYDEHPERLARLGAAALSETGEGFTIGCSYGIALLPHEAASSEDALRVADRRLYVSKQSGRTSARTQSCDVLLATMSERHEGLLEHNHSVATLAERLAGRLGLAAEQIETIRQAADLHDVGKVAIPDEILSKPGPLTDDEWVFMRQHSVIGERILSAAPALAQVAALVRASHERHDGAGYPDGLAGKEIPIGARIIAACDTFAAMTADRPYRTACSHAEAIRELERCAGTQFEPEVVAPLVELLSGRERRSPREAEASTAPVPRAAGRELSGSGSRLT
jgi:diguanylate cyclase (GGDEF)-like protein/putative nucleotidyltransferase with HDIG domain